MFEFSRHTLVHPESTTAVPSLRFAAQAAEWTQQRIETAKRLIAAYTASVAQTSALKDITDTDLWSGLVRENFSEMIGFIERNEPEPLSRFLVDFGSTYTWFGGVTTGVDGYNHWDHSEQSVAYSYFDKLLCLGEALGVLSAENPEQGDAGNWGSNQQRSPDEIVEAIQEAIGINIVPPMGIIPVAGIELKHGILHYRHMNALYLALRLHGICPGGRVCEYGAGIGLSAYYLSALGTKDITLFDIPAVNVLSAHFLIEALGGGSVCLEGEPQKANAVKVRANWRCEDQPDKHFDVSANQDSFPEINRRIFDAYVSQILRTTRSHFVSINHEVEHPAAEGVLHLNVSKLLSRNGGFDRVYRNPYWLRRGYVEELYRIAKRGGAAKNNLLLRLARALRATPRS